MKRREKAESTILIRLKEDYAFRTFAFSAFSFFVTAAFTCYNVFLGIAYKAVWNIGIAVYYALLLGIRAYVVFSEARLHKSGATEAQKERRRAKTFFVQSLFLFIIDIALVVPISLMVMQRKPNGYSMIPAIAMAAYTTFKIAASSKHVAKTRKVGHLGVKSLRNINFMDACVSILTLQYTLIMTFNGGIDKDMLTLSSITSFFIWVFLIIFSALAVVKAVKVMRRGA